jgi:hypothetical protein
LDLQPRIDLGVDYLSMDGFSESGGSDFRIRHNGEDTTYVNLQPAIDIATELETGDGLLIRPKLSLGITQFIGASAPSVTGIFASTPAEVAPFTTSTEQDKPVSTWPRASMSSRAKTSSCAPSCSAASRTTPNVTAAG